MESLGELREEELMQYRQGGGRIVKSRGHRRQSAVGQGIVEILTRRLINEPFLVKPLIPSLPPLSFPSHITYLVTPIMHAGCSSGYWKNFKITQSRHKSRKLLFKVIGPHSLSDHDITSCDSSDY